MQAQNDFNRNLTEFRAYLRFYDGLTLFQRTSWMVALIILLWLIALRLFPIENGTRWIFLPPVIWLAGVVVISVVRSFSLMQAALRVDLQLGLKECLSSSLAFMAEDRQVNKKPRYEGALVERLYENATRLIQEVDIREAFPVRLNMRVLTPAFIIILVCVLLMVLPNPMDAVVAERRAAREEARRQAEKIEALALEIEESETLNEEDKEELLEQLNDLAKKLRENEGDRQKALADLSGFEKELGERLDIGDSMKQAALESLAARLQELSGVQAGEGVEVEEMTEALNELAQLAASADENERQSIAQEISRMSAMAAQSGSNDLAQALAALSDAVGKGDSQAAAQASSSAQQALAQQKAEHAFQAALGQSLAQAQSSRQSLSGQMNSQNAGNSAMSGNNRGQGAGSGGGTNADSLPPASGAAMRVQAPRGNRSAAEADVLGQQVYVPRIEGATSGEELNIQGQDSGSGQEEIRDVPNPLPGMDNAPLVPYHEVYGQYLDAANEAMEKSYIPLDLKDYVRSYFSQLEP